ncbi:hypothetical protein NL676_002161 [Syzygium grande]|nr:hypothetical protein NL676_002161 [Syzygium grande]
MVARDGVLVAKTAATSGGGGWRLNRREAQLALVGKQPTTGYSKAEEVMLHSQGKSCGGGGVTASWSGPQRWLVRRGRRLVAG